MINVIVFSKNRACQLELFLRSMREMWGGTGSVTVIYTYSNEWYRAGYAKLIGENLFDFKLERNFKGDVIGSINKGLPYTVFFVDDMVWKEPFSIGCKEFFGFTEEDRALCMSLRLQHNLTHCYPANKVQRLPAISGGFLRWAGSEGDYGYPFSLDGHIFRTDDILPLMYGDKWGNPNQLEAWLSGFEYKFMKARPLMACCEKAPVMNIPLNQVQGSWGNRHGDIYTTGYLNNRFLDGFRISMDGIRGINNKSCHEEIDITLEKY